MSRFLFKWILRGSTRQYVIDKIKKPMMKAIITLASRYPEPIRENTRIQNTHILLEIKDKFFECEDNPCRKALFEALWKILIIEYEHDIYYRQRIDWMLEQIIESEWDFKKKNYPEKCWKEPR